MSHSLINLTLPVVIQEIEDVLDEYPEHPYQLAFSLPELHQRLVAYVLSQVPNHHVVEGIQETPVKPRVHHSTVLQERLRMEMIIRGGILHLLSENAAWLSHNLPRSTISAAVSQ